MNYNKNVYICVIYTISITLINYLRILLYDIVIDSLRQRTFVLACCLVFKYMLIHFDWPPLSRIHDIFNNIYSEKYKYLPTIIYVIEINKE